MKNLLLLLVLSLISLGATLPAHAQQHITKSGKPDKRYNENKHVKKDGTPDMRYNGSKKPALKKP